MLFKLDHSHCELKAAGVASDAPHYGTYWILANTYFERSVVMQRLEQLAIVESLLLENIHAEPIIHS